MFNNVSALKACSVFLVMHTVVTFLENLPDGKTSLGNYIPPTGKIPQWRFFAPNPGVDDIHVMYRTKPAQAGQWSPWRECANEPAASPISFMWNPQSRGPKAIFDIANQLRMMSGYPGTFPMAVRSQGFELLANEVRHHCRGEGRQGVFQWMILSARPGEGSDGLKPILVSPPAEVQGREQQDG